VIPHLVMLPFDFGRMQTHFEFAFKSNTHGSEEQSEGGTMEVDSQVTPKSQPLELKVIFGNGIFFDVIDGFGEVEGVALVPTFALVKVIVFLYGIADATFFGTIVKDEHANLMVEFDMEEGTLISVQPKRIDVLVTITPSLATTMEDLGVDAKVEETKATIIKE